jgi:hypothetical protein
LLVTDHNIAGRDKADPSGIRLAAHVSDRDIRARGKPQPQVVQQLRIGPLAVARACKPVAQGFEVRAETEYLRRALQHDDPGLVLAQIEHPTELFDEKIVDGIVRFRPVDPDETDIRVKPDLQSFVAAIAREIGVHRDTHS